MPRCGYRAVKVLWKTQFSQTVGVWGWITNAGNIFPNRSCLCTNIIVHKRSTIEVVGYTQFWRLHVNELLMLSIFQAPKAKDERDVSWLLYPRDVARRRS